MAMNDASPDEEAYQRLGAPMVEDAWQVPALRFREVYGENLV
jgi:hypothetical protein